VLVPSIFPPPLFQPPFFPIFRVKANFPVETDSPKYPLWFSRMSGTNSVSKLHMCASLSSPVLLIRELRPVLQKEKILFQKHGRERESGCKSEWECHTH